jgi:two-component system, sensor histidine kinase
MTGPPTIRVLLAEDDPVNRQVVEAILARVDAEIVTAVNGLEAVAAFRRSAFDVVLMDLQMPLMDGYTALGQIRAIERERGGRPTPLVVVSAHSSPTDVRDALAAGADFHLGKPVDLGRLLLIMTKAISTAGEADIARLSDKGG